MLKEVKHLLRLSRSPQAGSTRTRANFMISSEISPASPKVRKLDGEIIYSLTKYLWE